jgi:hypothetical protein
VIEKSANPHLGSTLDDFLREEGIYEKATVAAITKVIAWQLAEHEKKKTTEEQGEPLGNLHDEG